MKHEYTPVKIAYLIVSVLGRAKARECYHAEFSDVWACENFDNKVMKCDQLELGMVKGKEGELGLQGTIDVKSEIEDGTTMNVEVYKLMDIGKEYLYHSQGDICEKLKDDKTPWYPMFQAMHITKCPIPANSYAIKDMVVNLDYAKDVMTHEMCGEYVAQVAMTKNLDKLSCYEIGIIISEYSCEGEQD